MVLPYEPDSIDELIPKEFWEPVKVTVPVDYFVYQSVIDGWDWFTKCPFCKKDVRGK